MANQVNRDVLTECFRGALLGTMVGDALGMPVEGMSNSVIRARYDLVTESVTQLAQLPYTPNFNGPGFGVSPEGRWILSVEHSSNWDLMLVENFR